GSCGLSELMSRSARADQPAPPRGWPRVLPRWRAALMGGGPAPVLRWIAVAALLGAGCGAVATAARVSVREAGPLAALVDAGATVQADLVVRDDPRALGGAAGMPPSYLIAVDLSAVRQDDPAVTLRLDARAIVLGSDRAWRS